MKPTVRVTGKDTPPGAADACRQVLVGPGVNQPDPFPGYMGFVGWQSPLLLQNGELLVAFSAGYWHGAPPTPWLMNEETLERYFEIGMPREVDAPRGGQAMLIRSEDRGATWSKPEKLVDTHFDDRSPGLAQLSDGTVLCSFFVSSGLPNELALEHPDMVIRTRVIRSYDDGHSWYANPKPLPSSMVWDATDGPPLELADGSVLLVTYGSLLPEARTTHHGQDVLRSTDGGATWTIQGRLSTTEFELTESSIAQLPDGRLVFIGRKQGAISWSNDLGKTWTELETFGFRIFDPHLITLRDGTLICIHGSYTPGHRNLRVILSRDGGETWIAPGENYGFLIDESYGYARGIELPDGSVYLAYIKTGGHTTEDAQTNAVLAIRFRVREDLSGIDVLPATGW
jgi:hypothetical protein